MAKLRHHTDYLIVGGGITGLTAAALLEKSGKDYLLIEALEFMGGQVRAETPEALGGKISLDYGLKSLPVGESLQNNPLLKLKRTLGLSFGIETVTEAPQTFLKGDQRPFMGFGETKKRQWIEEYAYYTQSPRLLVSGGWQNLLTDLIALIPEDRRHTKTILTSLQTQDDMVVSAQINGETTITAKNIIFTLPPELLAGYLAQGAVNPKVLSRLAKSEALTAFSIELATPIKVSDAGNIFVLTDGAEDDFYVIGQFVSAADTRRREQLPQISSWLTFADTETVVDDEEASKVFRAMKKGIKKNFPKLIASSSWERLLVVTGAGGAPESLGLEKNLTVPGLSNLYLAGAKVKTASARGNPALRNTALAIDSAFQVVLEATGLEPEEVGTDTGEELLTLETPPLSELDA